MAILSTPLPAILAREVGRAVCQVTAISGCTASDPTTRPAPPAAPARPLDLNATQWAGADPTATPAADGSLQLARAAGPGPALPAIPPRYRSACQSGFEDSSFPHPLVCHAGLPVLDLDRNGVDDYKEPGRFRSQGYTDFNGDGTADATEPGAFTYGNPLYRPGQPGVRCLRDPDIAGRLDCGPYLDLLIKLSADQTPQITKSAGSFLAGLLPITDVLQAGRDASHGNILGGLLHALGIGGRAAGKALRGTRLVAGAADAAKAGRLARRLRALKRQRAAARAAGDTKPSGS